MDDINLELSETACIWDDMNEAIIGVDTNGRAVYSIPSMINLCITKYEMTEEEATEWVDFNMLNAYIGEGTPIHMRPNE